MALREVHERAPGSALWSRRQLARQRPLIERGLAIGLLLVSFVGSGLFGGGVEAWRSAQPNLIGVLVALTIQAVLSYGQYIYADSPGLVYGVLILVSTALTLAGYWPLVHPWLSAVLTSAVAGGAAEPYAPWLAGALLILVAGLVDVAPERILVR